MRIKKVHALVFQFCNSNSLFPFLVTVHLKFAPKISTLLMLVYVKLVILVWRFNATMVLCHVTAVFCHSHYYSAAYGVVG
jgi:hypothetical protein